MYRLKQIVVLVILIGLALVLVTLFAPPLFEDVAHRDDQLVQAPEYRVQSASCKTYLFVVSFCDIDLAATRGAGVVSQYAIVLGSTGGETVVPMKATSGNGYLTNSFARDNLWNRMTAFIIAALVVVAGLIGCVQRLRRGPPATVATGR